MEEIWKDVKDYEDLYQVSNLGRIRSKRGNKKILKQLINKDGYCIIRLRKNKKRKECFIHRLIATVFIDYNNYKFLDDEKGIVFNLSALTVNHKDFNKKNNNIYNLEWCTPRYNSTYTFKIYNYEKAKLCKIKEYIFKNNIDEKIKNDLLEIINSK